MSEELYIFYRSPYANISFKTFSKYAYLTIFYFILRLLGCLEASVSLYDQQISMYMKVNFYRAEFTE